MYMTFVYITSSLQIQLTHMHTNPLHLFLSIFLSLHSKGKRVLKNKSGSTKSLNCSFQLDDARSVQRQQTTGPCKSMSVTLQTAQQQQQQQQQEKDEAEGNKRRKEVEERYEEERNTYVYLRRKIVAHLHHITPGPLSLSPGFTQSLSLTHILSLTSLLLYLNNCLSIYIYIFQYLKHFLSIILQVSQIQTPSLSLSNTVSQLPSLLQYLKLLSRAFSITVSKILHISLTLLVGYYCISNTQTLTLSLDHYLLLYLKQCLPLSLDLKYSINFQV